MSKSENEKEKTAIDRLVEQGFEEDPTVKEYRENLILHDRFQTSIDQLAERVQYGEQQAITAIIGPTASGKTALISEFGFQFGVSMKSVPDSAKSTLLCMELAAPERGAFNWKDDFYIPGLVALKEPCATKKINVDELRERLQRGETNSIYSNEKIPVLRQTFYGALDRARVRAVLLDEGNHLRRPSSKSGVFAQYDSLKSRSNACRAHFALLGTTEMVDIFHQSGPISKRVFPIWLDPYTHKEKPLLGSFAKAIEEKFPLKLKFTTETKLDALFEGSLGYPGLLHEWFDRVLVRAIRMGNDVVSWADLDAMRLSPMQLAGILRELVQYRTVMNGAKTYFREQMRSLFLPRESPKSNQHGESGKPDAEKNGKKTKPGQRKPERDKVGE